MTPRSLLYAAITVALFQSMTLAGIIVDQQPVQAGGPGSDTGFINDSQQQVWQQLADDFVLTVPSTIRRVTWWGFYGGTFSGIALPPRGSEMMRVRFYEARPGDELPGTIIYEENFVNPSRVATGQTAFSITDAPEYIYQVTLGTPLTLASATTYWLEAVQVGDVDSTFRWEYALANGSMPFAALNDIVPDWHYSAVNANLAFQLSTVPEPATVMAFVVATCFRFRKRRPRMMHTAQLI